jgi:hypothetical protein
MPSCYHGFLNEVVGEYLAIRPETVLDVGVGFGKWGHLFREYGEVFVGRFEKSEWSVKIDGVEIFENYINAHEHQRYIYNNIHIGDISEVVDSLPDYDFIYAGDVIEHLPKDKALIVLEKLANKAKKCIMICIPLGPEEQWGQGEVYGNEHEKHLSFWNPNEFVGWEANIKRESRGYDIGLFKLRKI